MKIYTKTGDKGTTSLYGGTRVSKNHIRIESYGTVDELNSWLGLIRDQNIDTSHKNTIIGIQNNLFTIGAILATPIDKEILKNGKKRLAIPKISDSHIHLLEKEMDKMNELLPPMTHFILPGGHTTVSYCHIARSTCRRAERIVVKLFKNEEVEDKVLQYLNRLSDYLFVLARMLTKTLQAEEIKWVPEKEQ